MEQNEYEIENIISYRTFRMMQNNSVNNNSNNNQNTSSLASNNGQSQALPLSTVALMWILIVLGSIAFNYLYLKFLVKAKKRSGRVEDFDQDGVKQFYPVDFESSEEYQARPSVAIQSNKNQILIAKQDSEQSTNQFQKENFNYLRPAHHENASLITANDLNTKKLSYNEENFSQGSVSANGTIKTLGGKHDNFKEDGKRQLNFPEKNQNFLTLESPASRIFIETPKQQNQNQIQPKIDDQIKTIENKSQSQISSVPALPAINQGNNKSPQRVHLIKEINQDPLPIIQKSNHDSQQEVQPDNELNKQPADLQQNTQDNETESQHPTPLIKGSLQIDEQSNAQIVQFYNQPRSEQSFADKEDEFERK